MTWNLSHLKETKIYLFLNKIGLIKSSFTKDFIRVSQEFNLEGQIEIREDWWPPMHRFILFRIIENEEDRIKPLPPALITKVESLVKKHYGKSIRRILGTKPTFLVNLGKTIAEIKKDQEDWKFYCDLFWIGAEG